MSRKTTTVATKSRARKSPRRQVTAETAAKDRSQPQFAPIRTKRVFEEICEQVRREMFPTEDELADAYLAQAGDIYDLESRMRELERNRRRTAFGWRA